MNKKDFTWIEKRFGTRFANILKTNLSDNNADRVLDKFIINDLSEILQVIPTKEDKITYEVLNSDLSQVAVEVVADYTEIQNPTEEQDKYAEIVSYGPAQYCKKNDTLYVQGIYGYELGTNRQSNEELMLVVDDVVVNSNDDVRLTVHAINGKTINNIMIVPTIDEGTSMFLCGHINDGNIYSLGTIDVPMIENYIQKFDISFEENSSNVKGVITENSLLNTEELIALNVFNIRKNNSLLIGVASNQEHTTKGIWKQAGKEMYYNSASMNEAVLIDMCKRAFSNSLYNHSDTKILLAGCELAGTIYKTLQDNVITSPFGNIIMHVYNTFSDVGYDGMGIVLDPAYAKFYSKSPLKATFNNDIMTFTEECCVVLENSKTHMRIVKA